MPQTYRSLIIDYCARCAISVPIGFGRNTPSRYVVIRTDQSPPKLVATTWLKQKDVAYYFEHFLVPQIGSEAATRILVLDFKEGRRLLYAGSNRFTPDGILPQMTQMRSPESSVSAEPDTGRLLNKPASKDGPR